MITVWHRQHEPDRRARIALLNALDRISYRQSQETPPPIDLAVYCKVAEVDTDDPEEAYAVVQNKDGQNWQHHPKIRWAAPPPQRAHTDVGDLLQCSDRWLAVAAIGTLPVRVLDSKENYETTL